MRNYELMRNILKAVEFSDKPLVLLDFAQYGKPEQLRDELIRLKDEGLIEHNMSWSCGCCDGGEVTAITKEGRAFLRNISNDKVWAIIENILNKAEIDLSYPFLKEICDEVVKRYIISKIPKFD